MVYSLRIDVPHQAALEGLGSGTLGDVVVRRKAVASETVMSADILQWTVVFLSKVRAFLDGSATI